MPRAPIARRRRAGGRAASGACSSTTCAFVPPKPNGYARDARPILLRPRAGGALHAKRQHVEGDARVGRLEMQARENLQVVERQDGLDQSRDAGRGLERPAQLLQIPGVAPDVVVEERDDLPLIPGNEILEHPFPLGDVANDHLRRTGVEPRPDAGQRAEVAAERAATRGLEGERNEIFPGAEIESRDRDLRGVVRGRDVAPPQLAALEIGDDVADTALRVADHHGIEKRLAEMRVRARHEPAVDRLRAAAPEVVRDLPRPVEVRVDAGDAEALYLTSCAAPLWTARSIRSCIPPSRPCG